MKLLELSNHLNISFQGDPNKEIEGLTTPQEPDPKKLCYVSNKKFINNNLKNAGAVLCSEELVQFIPNKNIIFSNATKIVFAEITNIFASKYLPINPKIFKEKNVKIGLNFLHGHNVVIEDSAVLGENVTLSHNVVIHKGVKIGNNVIIGSGTVIGSEGFGNVLNPDGSWKHVTHHGSVIICNNVSIGSNCSIDRGTIGNTVLNNGVIIDNQVHIAHNVEIGENTAIAANVGIAGSTKIGKRNLIGGMVGIIDHITTVDDVTISATSTVSRNIKKPGVYTGIMPISQHALWKRLAFWITKLDKIAKLINFKN